MNFKLYAILDTKSKRLVEYMDKPTYFTTKNRAYLFMSRLSYKNILKIVEVDCSISDTVFDYDDVILDIIRKIDNDEKLQQSELSYLLEHQCDELPLQDAYEDDYINVAPICKLNNRYVSFVCKKNIKTWKYEITPTKVVELIWNQIPVGSNSL